MHLCLITISGEKMTQSPEKVLLQYKNDENFATLTAKIVARNTTLKALALGNQAPIAAVNQIATPSCVYYNDNHAFDNCLFNPDYMCYIGHNRINPYFNPYNPSWRKHSNFSWLGQAARN